MQKVQLVGHQPSGEPRQSVKNIIAVKLTVVDGCKLATSCGVVISNWRTSVNTWSTGLTSLIVKPRQRVRALKGGNHDS